MLWLCLYRCMCAEPDPLTTTHGVSVTPLRKWPSQRYQDSRPLWPACSCHGLWYGRGCLRSRRHYYTETYSKALGISYKWLVLLHIVFYTAVVSGLQLPKVFPSGKGLPCLSPVDLYSLVHCQPLPHFLHTPYRRGILLGLFLEKTLFPGMPCLQFLFRWPC